MPIRFQVDADFYDHPKTIGMSDAAYKLWTRAGSYAAAKTTDGLITHEVLGEVLRTDKSVADELVTRKLWKRAKGGYRFHQWDHRNLTRKRIEADKQADRDRKKRAREDEKAMQSGVDPEQFRTQNGVDHEHFRTPVDNSGEPSTNGRPKRRQTRKPKADPGNVHPESEQTPNGIHPDSGPDSERIPGASVSVSVSESVSQGGSAAVPEPPATTTRPPDRCPKHLKTQNPPKCGPCADARRDREHWDATAGERERRTPRCPTHRGQPRDHCASCRADRLAAN